MARIIRVRLYYFYARDIIILCTAASSEKKNCHLGKFYGHYDPALFHARLLHVKERRRAGSLIILYTVLMSDGCICRRAVDIIKQNVVLCHTIWSIPLLSLHTRRSLLLLALIPHIITMCYGCATNPYSGSKLASII